MIDDAAAHARTVDDMRETMDDFARAFNDMAAAMRDDIVALCRKFLADDTPYPKTVPGFVAWLNEYGGGWLIEGIGRTLRGAAMADAHDNLIQRF